MAASAASAKESGSEKTEGSAPAPAKGGGGSKLVLILTGVNLVVTLAIVGVLMMSFQKERKSASAGDIAPTEHKSGEGAAAEGGHGEAAKAGEHGDTAKPSTDYGKMIALEQFIVNLSTPGSATPKFVRVNISIEVGTVDSEAEVTSKMPQVRNVIIDLFNSKHPSDLASAEGRDYLKEQIRNALNGFMVTGKIRGVFFTNFHLTT